MKLCAFVSLWQKCVSPDIQEEEIKKIFTARCNFFNFIVSLEQEEPKQTKLELKQTKLEPKQTKLEPKQTKIELKQTKLELKQTAYHHKKINH